MYETIVYRYFPWAGAYGCPGTLYYSISDKPIMCSPNGPDDTFR